MVPKKNKDNDLDVVSEGKESNNDKSVANSDIKRSAEEDEANSSV